MSDTVYVLLQPSYRSLGKFWSPDKPNLACSPEQFRNRIRCFKELMEDPKFPALCSHIRAQFYGRPDSSGNCEILRTHYYYLQTGQRVKPSLVSKAVN